MTNSIPKVRDGASIEYLYKCIGGISTERFQNLTGAAKLLYMILLDRRCLSELNGDAWRDDIHIFHNRRNYEADAFRK